MSTAKQISMEKQIELLEIVKPVMKWINDNLHPLHHKIIITNDSLELLEAKSFCMFKGYIKD